MLIKFRQILMKWLRAADYEAGGENAPIEAYTATINSSRHTVGLKQAQPKISNNINIHTNGITFQVWPASGGLVVQTQSWNDHKEENLTSLHVIHDGDEVHQSLAHILSLESLRR